MRLRFVALAAIAIALTFGSQTPSTQSSVVIDQGLAERAARGGRVPVIVGVQMAFTPEGDLGGPADVARQRESIQRAVEDVSDRAVASGVQVYRRFNLIPYFTAAVTAEELVALAATPGVMSIDEDRLERVSLTQSVPLIGASTSHAGGFTGAGWNVAVLDTGVDKTHPFLSGKVVSEACFSNAGGAGSGFSPPSSSVCPGGANSSTATGSGVNCNLAIDGCDHGTHVAGIVGGRAGLAGAPVSGVAPGANIIAIQVFSRFDDATTCGGASFTPCALTYTSDQVAALNHVFSLAGMNNANQIASANMSLGGGSFTSNCDATNGSRKAAIDNLLSIGIATAIATGNDGSSSSISSPACISSAIAVGSTTKSDAMSSFSNRRPGLVDVVAPGSSISSSVPGAVYSSFSGTSMATPHVAGAWALLKQAVPSAAVANVLTALQATGIAINDTSSGGVYQRISVNAARLALAGGGTGGAPGAPGAPTISGSGNSVTISWTPPTTGGAPTSYTINVRLACGGGIVQAIPVGGLLTVNATAPNGTFCLSIFASNASGNGPESAGTSFNVPIVAPPPGAPTNLAVVVAGTIADFTWTPPTTGGAITSYALVASLTPAGAPIAILPFSPTFTSVRVTGIPPGTFYVRLIASNAGGDSPPSNTVTVNVAGPQPPGAPTMNPATVSASRVVSMSWSPGGGGAATSFTVLARLSPSGPVIATLPVAGTSISVPAPTGTFYLSVVGVNSLGTSPESNQVAVTVP